MGAQVVWDDAGVGREAERAFAPYRAAVEAQWEIERAAHAGDVLLDLMVQVDLRTHRVEFAYRTQLAFRPSKSAGEAFGCRNRDALWVWLRHADDRNRFVFGLLWPRIRGAGGL